MKFQQLKVNSPCDDLPLGVAVMAPETDPVGIVQLVHGMSEHKERYYDFMNVLAAQGYVTIIHDHRGHGESVRSQDDLGYFYDETGKFIVEDTHWITQWVKAQYPGLPLVLFGHSMGSLVVRNVLKWYDRELDGLIVCGSPSQRGNLGLGLWLIRRGIRKRGDHYRSKFINRLATGKGNKKFEDGTSDKLWLSSDRQSVCRYEEDPLCGFIFTLNGFLNLLQVMREVYTPENWRLEAPDLPILFLAGAEDPVIISPHAWRKSMAFLRKRGYRRVDGKLYPKMRHEILNEKENEQVYEDVLRWLNSGSL